MNALRPVLGIQATAAHLVFCGLSLLFLVLIVPRLAIPQQGTDQQQTKPQAQSSSQPIGASNIPVIRSHVRQVLFDVVATDFRDRPVSGLQQTDFSVYEDGKIQ